MSHWVLRAGAFNFDFTVSITEEQQREGIEYNYRREAGGNSRDRLERGAGMRACRHAWLHDGTDAARTRVKGRA